MREHRCTLAGKELVLTATFAASVRIADSVADPLQIARESALEMMMMEKGFPYTPKFQFNVKNIPLLLQIGLEAAGEKWKIEDVQEIVFDAGFAEARDAVIEYLGLIVGPAPEKEVKGAKAEKVGE